MFIKNEKIWHSPDGCTNIPTNKNTDHVAICVGKRKNGTTLTFWTDFPSVLPVWNVIPIRSAILAGITTNSNRYSGSVSFHRTEYLPFRRSICLESNGQRNRKKKRVYVRARHGNIQTGKENTLKAAAQRIHTSLHVIMQTRERRIQLRGAIWFAASSVLPLAATGTAPPSSTLVLVVGANIAARSIKM